MADTKDGREEQAHRAERRQREREVAEALGRGDESEPDPGLEAVDADDLAAVESELAELSYPVTAEAVLEVLDDRELATRGRPVPAEDLVPRTDRVRFESPRDVRARIARPTVATALRRITEAIGTVEDLPQREFDERLDAYERTFRELAAVAPDEYDEGISVLADWIVDVVHRDGRVPSSRAVRRRGAVYCRANGYEVRDDSWLSV